MTKETKIIIGLLVVSTVAIMGLGSYFTKKTQPATLNARAGAEIDVVGSKLHSWGQVDIDGGNVEHTFQIKNIGSADLEVTNFKTSCMCTETQIIVDGERSPIFGMHTRSNWKATVKPGESADINVVFDPMFHGPQGTGPITRIVSFETNDPKNSIVELRVAGNVVRLD